MVNLPGLGRLFLFYAVLLAASPPAAGSDPLFTGMERSPVRSSSAASKVTVTVVDAATGDTLTVRCNVIDEYHSSKYPVGSYYYMVEEGYFYTDGSFSVYLPEGPATVTVGHGYEYERLVASIDVVADTSVVLEMTRLTDMNALGWYCGDTHAHINHIGGVYNLSPQDAHLIGRAEGLDVINCLDNDYCFTGGPDPCSTEETIVYMGEELRSGSLGHTAVLGLSAPVTPFDYGWWPLLGDLADIVHSQEGALFISAHPVSSEDFDDTVDWPASGIARELPVDVARGKVDAFEVMSYSNCHGGLELEMWYHFLNCGFKLPGCAGTDAAMNRLRDYPVGVFRTYVLVDGGELDYEAWLEGLERGRTFMTNGPLFTRFDVLTFLPGDSLNISYQREYHLPVRLTIECDYPLDRAEIVINGVVEHTIFPAADPCRIDTAFNISIDECSWVAARVVGPPPGWLFLPDSLYAHTGPVYFDMEDKRLVRNESALWLIEWIDELVDLAVAKGEYPSSADSVEALAVYAAARDYYIRLTRMAVGIEENDPGTPSTPQVLLRNCPNPFSSATEIRFVFGGSGDIDRSDLSAGRAGLSGGGSERVGASLRIYDVSGRLVRKLFEGETVPGEHIISWDGTDDAGGRIASGVYFCRLRIGGMESGRKIVYIR